MRGSLHREVPRGSPGAKLPDAGWSIGPVVSVELAKQRCRRLDDNLGHFNVRVVDERRGSVGHQAAQLVQLQVALAQQSFEHGQDVNDECGLRLAQNHDAIDVGHDAETNARMPV